MSVADSISSMHACLLLMLRFVLLSGDFLPMLLPLLLLVSSACRWCQMQQHLRLWSPACQPSCQQ
jgi:hypothetical protein